MSWSKSDVAVPARSNRCLLLVEDNPGDVALVRHFLRDSGDEIAHVDTLRDARKCLASRHFDLILLDLHLADAEQLGLVSAIQQMARSPIVVLTGLEEDDLAHRCLDAGVQDYVRKADISAITLSRAIDHAISRHRVVELRQRLETAERHASVGRLTAAVAHEINNQAMVLLAASEQAKLVIEGLGATGGRSPGDEVEQLSALIGSLSDGVGGIAEIVDQLQVFAREEEPRALATVDLSLLADRILRLLASSIRRVARLTTDLQPGALAVATEQRVGQVLVNLVRNAIDALDNNKEGNQITVSTRLEGDRVLLVVADNGHGIPEHQRQHLFEPFFTSKQGRRGTGIGLAVSREIVSGFSGTIEFESEVGKGATFTVTLPAAIAEAEKQSPRTSDPVHPYRVLLIDDDPRTRGAVAKLLGRHHDVVACEGGAAALRLLSSDDAFDAVLCDVMMPEMNGFEVSRAIIERHPRLVGRVALLSGGAFTDDTQTTLADTELMVLNKPCTYAQLRSAIAELAGAAAPVA